MLLVISTLAVYALQPALPVRGLDFWLPTLTLGLTVLGWVLTTPRQQRLWRDNWLAVAILGGIVLALGLTRYLGFSLPLTASNPPQIFQILIVLAIIAAAGFLLWQFSKPGKLILSVAFIFYHSYFCVSESPGAIGMGQPGTARLERTVYCAGFSTGFTLAGFFVYRFSPAAHSA